MTLEQLEDAVRYAKIDGAVSFEVDLDYHMIFVDKDGLVVGHIGLGEDYISDL